MAELIASREDAPAPKLSEREVVAYLKAHTDFLSRHPDLLETIELRHKAGSAVSLIEKQVDMLRAKNQRLEDRMQRLVDTARDNERRTQNIQRLARTLTAGHERPRACTLATLARAGLPGGDPQRAEAEALVARTCPAP